MTYRRNERIREEEGEGKEMIDENVFLVEYRNLFARER